MIFWAIEDPFIRVLERLILVFLAFIAIWIKIEKELQLARPRVCIYSCRYGSNDCDLNVCWDFFKRDLP